MQLNSKLMAGVASVLLLMTSSAQAHQEGLFSGVELGAVIPVDAYSKFSSTGGIVSPYVGYNLNEYIGVWGHAHALGSPEKNGSNRRGVKDDDATWAAGATAGPRLAYSLGNVELWGTGEIGFMSGLCPNCSITDTSFAYTTGGGLTGHVTEHITLGTFARWNHLFQRAHHVGEVRFISTGINIGYEFEAPAPPLPAPAVAQAPPPPPPPAMKKKIVLRGVNFDFDKANIRPDARPILDEAVRTLKDEGAIAVVAEGHTDSKGTDAYNQQLSTRRAQSVKDYMVKGGVTSSRVDVEGFGESKPVANNDTDDGRAQNRRVELKVKE